MYECMSVGIGNETIQVTMGGWREVIRKDELGQWIFVTGKKNGGSWE